jgi:hypothetical protein
MGKKIVRQQALDSTPSLKYPYQRIAQVTDIRGGGIYEVVLGSVPIAAANSDTWNHQDGDHGDLEAVENGLAMMDENDGKLLVQMPPKFRKLIWVKRGNVYIYLCIR